MISQLPGMANNTFNAKGRQYILASTPKILIYPDSHPGVAYLQKNPAGLWCSCLQKSFFPALFSYYYNHVSISFKLFLQIVLQFLQRKRVTRESSSSPDHY
ncbi:hypothetical protein ACB098_05G220600 [Castanea mollissima]